MIRGDHLLIRQFLDGPPVHLCGFGHTFSGRDRSVFPPTQRRQKLLFGRNPRLEFRVGNTNIRSKMGVTATNSTATLLLSRCNSFGVMLWGPDRNLAVRHLVRLDPAKLLDLIPQMTPISLVRMRWNGHASPSIHFRNDLLHRGVEPHLKLFEGHSVNEEMTVRRAVLRPMDHQQTSGPTGFRDLQVLGVVSAVVIRETNTIQLRRLDGLHEIGWRPVAVAAGGMNVHIDSGRLPRRLPRHDRTAFWIFALRLHFWIFVLSFRTSVTSFQKFS